MSIPRTPMKVELTTQQARGLVVFANSRLAAPGNTHAADGIAALTRAIAEAERPQATDAPTAEPNAHPPRPQWDRVAGHPLAAAAAEVGGKNPGMTEQGGAALRDSFCAKGLSVDDEGTIYTAFTVVSSLYETTKALSDSGLITGAQFDDAAKTQLIFANALLDHFPEEARTHG